MTEHPTDDAQLLEAFRASKSEAAFRQIVTKYLGMVYGVARRKTRDHFVAEEISQNVFSTLARKASRLRGGPTLAGWLYRCTAIECAAFHRRNEVRQKAMNTLANDPPAASEEPQWKEILPVLDDAIAELTRADRDLVLMRFFEGKKFSEIGAALGKSPVAAQKQGERALAKLAGILARKGVAVPVGVLAAGLGAQLSQAAPAGLVFSISTGALAGISGLSAKTFILESIRLMANTKLKATAVALAVALPLGLAWKTNHDLKNEVARLRAESTQTQRNGADHIAVPSGGALVPVKRVASQAAASAAAQHEPERPPLDPASALETALLESDPLRRMERLAQLLSKLTQAEAPQLAEKFGELRSRGLDFPTEFRLFLRAWGKLDGLTAMENAWQASDPSGAREVKASPEMMSALAGWASTAPFLAQQWIEALPESDEKEKLVYGLLDGWSIVDFRGAAAYAESRPRSQARDKFRELLMERAISSGGIAAAQQWAEQIPNDPHNELYKQRAFDEVVRSMLYRDPAAAAAWIQQHQTGGYVGQNSVYGTAQKLAETAPVEALAWLNSIQNSRSESLAPGFAAVIHEWASDDPGAAGQWLVGQASDPSYDEMAGAYARQIASDNPATAVQWAQSVRDEAKRSKALDLVAEQVLRGNSETGEQALRLAGYTDAMIEAAQKRSQSLLIGLNEAVETVAHPYMVNAHVSARLAGQYETIRLAKTEHDAASQSWRPVAADLDVRFLESRPGAGFSIPDKPAAFYYFEPEADSAFGGELSVENARTDELQSIPQLEISAPQQPASDEQFLKGFLDTHGPEGLRLRCAECHQ